MSVVTDEEVSIIKEATLTENIELNILVNNNPVTIKGLNEHDIQFPIKAAVGKVLEVYIKIVAKDAPPTGP